MIFTELATYKEALTETANVAQVEPRDGGIGLDVLPYSGEALLRAYAVEKGVDVTALTKDHIKEIGTALAQALVEVGKINATTPELLLALDGVLGRTLGDLASSEFRPRKPLPLQG